jgi:hydroxymethylglutaryl-CoA lyase
MKIIECPRDAMQGIKDFIPTKEKVEYINSLLHVGFETLDFGSFVSPKAIPQMQDTAAVLEDIDLSAGNTRLLAIVANKRGADEACEFEEISCLGFPFSISETFQQRNANSSIEESVKRVQEIYNLCRKKKKELVVYISMAFGNPYGDPYDQDVVFEWTRKLSGLGVKTISLADTIGSSTPELITSLFSSVIPEFPKVEIGAHLHSRKESSLEKIKAAYESGCRRFDGALQGFGGCPMAKDELTGNIDTNDIISFLEKNKIDHGLNKKALELANAECKKLFAKYH